MSTGDLELLGAGREAEVFGWDDGRTGSRRRPGCRTFATSCRTGSGRRSSRTTRARVPSSASTRFPTATGSCTATSIRRTCSRAADGCVVIDWTNGMSGDPAADVARTILLLGGGKLVDGTPVVVRVIAPVARRLLVSSYLRSYAREAPLDRRLVERWLAVWAAARLSEDVEQEREFLLGRAR